MPRMLYLDLTSDTFHYWLITEGGQVSLTRPPTIGRLAGEWLHARYKDNIYTQLPPLYWLGGRVLIFFPLTLKKIIIFYTNENFLSENTQA